jgi:hypothetical protein
MEVIATPFCSVLAGVPVKDGKVALTLHAAKVVHEGVGVFHGSTAFLVLVG